MKRGLATLCVGTLFAVVACRQLVGIGDQPPGAGTPDASSGEAGSEAAGACGGFPWATEACGACVEGACCAEAEACRGDLACAPMLDCMAACAGNDDLCRGACVTQVPGAAMQALASCQARSCAPACNLVCGGFFGLTGTGTPGPCLSCYEVQACAFATECAQTPSCLTAQFCGQACLRLDTVCGSNCEYSTPVDLPADAGMGFGPGNNACAAACGVGTTWSCVGHAAWPIATAPSISFQVGVVDGASGSPVGGAQVDVCPALDQNCLQAISTGKTDANGLVTLTSSSVPFSGYVQIAAPGYSTDLLYLYPYLAESTVPGVVLTDTLYSTDELSQIAAQAHVTLDPSLGIIAADPRDCTATPAAGVSFSGSGLGDAASSYYFVGSTPTPLATQTSLPEAAGGFYNVEPGLVTFTASENGTTIDTVAVYVRAGALTQLQLVPTP